MPGQINIPPAQPVDQGYREENPNSAMVATGWRTWLVRVYELLTGLTSSGTSAQRPTKNLWVGYQYFDTDLAQQIVWSGTVWVLGAAYGQLTINISHFQTINATWSPVTGYDTSLATPIDVVQNAAAGTLALTDTGTYLLTITAAIAFTSSNAGRSFQFRMFNVTDSVVAAGPLTIYVGRDIAGVNMAISTRFIAAASGKAMRIEMGNGDTFSAVQIQDMSYGVNRI